jgi:hypothetical protein
MLNCSKCNDNLKKKRKCGFIDESEWLIDKPLRSIYGVTPTSCPAYIYYQNTVLIEFLFSCNKEGAIFNPMEGYVMPMAIMDFGIYLNILRDAKREKEKDSKENKGFKKVF